MSARLAHQTAKTAGISNGMRTATIAAIDATTGAVTLSIAGGTFSDGVGVISSYAPQVGETVAVFRQDSSWLVLGAIPGTSGLTSGATVTGTVSISFTAQNTTTATVSFGSTFSSPPAVMTNIDSGAGPTARWTSRAINITTTGFTVFAYYAADNTTTATWSNIPISWVATAR